MISLLGRKKSTVLGAADPLNVFYSSFAYPKGTSLRQDASFEPSTINIGSGVRPEDVRKKKKGYKGREGMEGKMDNALKGTEVLYFTHVPRSPPATDCHQNVQVD